MTTKMKWLIVAVVAVPAGVFTVGALLVGWFLWHDWVPRNPLLPVYKLEQTDSTHPWYLRTTVTCGAAVFVNDYEDYPVLLANPVPTHAIGRPPFGNSLVCSIPGQNPTDYIAMDCGSEMPAYEVFRNVNRPPFDWRHAKFRALEFTGLIGQTEHKRTTDPVPIAEVVRTLSEGTPTTLPLPAAMIGSNSCAVKLDCEQLPGLVFCPQVYRDAAGPVYLAESFAVEYTNRTERVHARWIPASPLFTQWVQTP